MLMSLCGSPLKRNMFLDDMLELRNTVCQQWIVNERGVDQGMKKHASIKDIVSDLKLPSTIEVQCGDIATHPFTLSVVFEAEKTPVVATRVTSDSLDFIIEQVRASTRDGHRGMKRPQSERKRTVCEFMYDEIKWNYERQSYYVEYTDADSRPRKKHKAPLRSDMFALSEEHNATAQNALHAFYTTHHHAASQHDGTDAGGEDAQSDGDSPPTDNTAAAPHVEHVDGAGASHESDDAPVA